MQAFKFYSSVFSDDIRKSAPDCGRLLHNLLEHIVLVAALAGVAVAGFDLNLAFSDSAAVKIENFQSVLFQNADFAVVYSENSVAFLGKSRNIARKEYTAARNSDEERTGQLGANY